MKSLALFLSSLLDSNGSSWGQSTKNGSEDGQRVLLSLSRWFETINHCLTGFSRLFYYCNIWVTTRGCINWALPCLIQEQAPIVKSGQANLQYVLSQLLISTANQRLPLLVGGKLKLNCPVYSNMIRKIARNLAESQQGGTEGATPSAITADNNDYCNHLIMLSGHICW